MESIYCCSNWIYVLWLYRRFKMFLLKNAPTDPQFLNESDSALSRANNLLHIKHILKTWIWLNLVWVSFSKSADFVLRPVVRSVCKRVWKIKHSGDGRLLELTPEWIGRIIQRQVISWWSCWISYTYLFWYIAIPRRGKTCLRGFANIKGQSSLLISAVWSAPFLNAYCKVSYLTGHKGTFNVLASYYSWADWFESHFGRFIPRQGFSWWSKFIDAINYQN